MALPGAPGRMDYVAGFPPGHNGPEGGFARYDPNLTVAAVKLRVAQIPDAVPRGRGRGSRGGRGGRGGRGSRGGATTPVTMPTTTTVARGMPVSRAGGRVAGGATTAGDGAGAGAGSRAGTGAGASSASTGAGAGARVGAGQLSILPPGLPNFNHLACFAAVLTQIYAHCDSLFAALDAAPVGPQTPVVQVRLHALLRAMRTPGPLSPAGDLAWQSFFAALPAAFHGGAQDVCDLHVALTDDGAAGGAASLQGVLGPSFSHIIINYVTCPVGGCACNVPPPGHFSDPRAASVLSVGFPPRRVGAGRQSRTTLGALLSTVFQGKCPIAPGYELHGIAGHAGAQHTSVCTAWPEFPFIQIDRVVSGANGNSTFNRQPVSIDLSLPAGLLAPGQPAMQLVAVVYHVAATRYAIGHYAVLARHSTAALAGAAVADTTAGPWHIFNDSQTTLVNPNAVRDLLRSYESVATVLVYASVQP